MDLQFSKMDLQFSNLKKIFNKQYQNLELQIETESNDLGDRIDAISGQMGRLNERQLRAEIAKKYGEKFAEPVTVHGIEDLVQLAFSINANEYPKESSSDIYEAASKLAGDLDAAGYGSEMLTTFFSKLVNASSLGTGDKYDQQLDKFRQSASQAYLRSQFHGGQNKIVTNPVFCCCELIVRVRRQCTQFRRSINNSMHPVIQEMFVCPRQQ
jgi:hypothetical protein